MYELKKEATTSGKKGTKLALAQSSKTDLVLVEIKLRIKLLQEDASDDHVG